jgi:gas vesicle protein
MMSKHTHPAPDHSLQNFLLGLLIGLLSGGLLALLLSPKSGEENRKTAKRFVEEIPDVVKEEWENPYSKTSDFINKQRFKLESSWDSICKALQAERQAKAKQKEEDALDTCQAKGTEQPASEEPPHPKEATV